MVAIEKNDELLTILLNNKASFTHSVNCTTHVVVGIIKTIDLCGVPWKPNARYGSSNSNGKFFCWVTLSIKPLNAAFNLLRKSRSA